MNQRPQTRLHSLAWHAANNIKALRPGSAEKLAAEVRREGVDMNRSALANIENKRRADLTLEEVSALAIALNVSPTNLLLPLEGSTELVAVTPNREDSASFVRAWIYGDMRLPSVKEDTYDPQLEFEFKNKAAPAHERRERDERFSRHPITMAAAELMTYARAGVLGPTERITPQLLADAIRRTADKVAARAHDLADDLENQKEWTS